MKNKNIKRNRYSRRWASQPGTAFTLIELLVVVLIISILVAIAVPQYQKAVEKSYATEAMVQVRSLANAQKRYYLANNTYTENFEELDISFPGRLNTNKDVVTQTNWELVLISVLTYGTVYARRIGPGHELNNGRWYIVYDLNTDKLSCGAIFNDTPSNDLCKAISGKTERTTSITTYEYTID